MDISVAGLFGVSPRSDAAHAVAFAQAAEALGFRGLYLPEHVVFFPEYESDYPYTDDGSPTWGPELGIYDPLFVAVAAAPHHVPAHEGRGRSAQGRPRPEGGLGTHLGPAKVHREHLRGQQQGQQRHHGHSGP